jgi:acyl-CoA synthetase (NDP forming)/RimJ/RimL family protein N-acetyltransferase
MTRHRLSPLLDPGSIALYGATERPDALGRRVLEKVRAGGFRGPVGAINPKHRSVLGMRCVPSAADLDFVPDVALAAVPARALPGVVDDCARRGTRFLVVHSAGFDTGTLDGRAGEAALLRRARERGVRLLGPRCTALMRPSSGLEAGLAPGRVKPGRIALLSQSGAVLSALVDWAVPSGIGFSSVASLGTAIDLDFGELLDWYLFDPQTDSVLLYLEDVRDARRFMSSVRALSRAKPVVIMKAGVRRALPGDAQEGASHSGSLVGDDRVCDAAIGRAGAVRAETTLQLLAAARLLALRKRLAGPRVAIVGNGAGPGVIAADAVARRSLSLATLAPDTLAAIDAAGARQRGGDGERHGANPLDLRAEAGAPFIEATLRATLADPGVDATLMLFVPQRSTTSTQAAEAIIAATDGQPKPVAAVLAGGASARPGQDRLDAAGIAHFLTPENAVDALALLEGFARNQQTLRQVPVAVDEGFAPDFAAAEAIRRRVLAQGRALLDEAESAALLAAFGIAARTPGRSRYRRELYLGMAIDPTFGAVIAFGGGGAAIEQIDDVAVGLPPLNGLLARALVARTRTSRLLRAYRSVPAVDDGALEQTLVRFSTLICACPWLASVDINPLVADESGTTALDARIAVRTPDAIAHVPWRGPYGHLAIHPYPRELEERVVLKNGTTVLLRPIRPEDAGLERDFVAALSPQTLYRRFMMPVKQLSDQMIERFTQIDYDRELALVALEAPPGAEPGAPGSRISGVARITPTWEDGVAEFAIVVGDWMQHSGLGRELMQRLFEACLSRGYDVIEGVVLGENTSMLRFCERLGFTIRMNPDDLAERIARRQLR